MKFETKKFSKFTWSFIFVLCFIVLFFYLSNQVRQNWTAFFFPAGCDDKSYECVSRRIVSPVLHSKNACMKWGADTLYGHNGAPAANPKDYFSCEEGCKFYLGEDKCHGIIQGYRDTN